MPACLSFERAQRAADARHDPVPCPRHLLRIHEIDAMDRTSAREIAAAVEHRALPLRRDGEKGPRHPFVVERTLTIYALENADGDTPASYLRKNLRAPIKLHLADACMPPPRSVIVTVAERPFDLFVTLTLEPNLSVLWAAVIALSSRGTPLAVRVPRCDRSPIE